MKVMESPARKITTTLQKIWI